MLQVEAISLALIRTFAVSNARWQKNVLDKTERVTLSLPDLTGHQRALKEWRNKVLALNFWPTWCSPCRKEISELIILQKQCSNKVCNLVVLLLKRAPVLEFLQNYNVNCPILIAGDAGIYRTVAFGNHPSSLLFAVIVDRQGYIFHRQSGRVKKLLLEIFTTIDKRKLR